MSSFFVTYDILYQFVVVKYHSTFADFLTCVNFVIYCLQKKPRYAPRSKASLHNEFTDADEESLREEVLYDSDMRARLLDNTERVARSAGRLEDGLRVALQTEEVGTHILTDLGEQREKLQRSRNRLRQADTDLNKSSRIISEMTRRVIQNRMVLIGMVILMILIFIVAIYLVTRRGTPVVQSPPVFSNPVTGIQPSHPLTESPADVFNSHH
ncbi:vesicle transport through interaction with t-SNAREs 1 [Paragonimus westermani]|uniref:Vesicle transport through interaction with t-SNAREs 1 n=1 Tax=Paragonimus westermani TaxID=34504 RepID=A0A5J4NB82_9TREM|nr:vesicle transport through interaction with t-SNAREs 1 [Paragonimus westermani]